MNGVRNVGIYGIQFIHSSTVVFLLRVAITSGHDDVLIEGTAIGCMLS